MRLLAAGNGIQTPRILVVAARRATMLACCAGLLAGCSSATATPGAAVGTTCGSTQTGTGVPVVIKVAKGTVDCGLAMQVENEYAAKIKSGQIQGNGGGAPVKLNGWTCQGFNTPQVLSTGDASQCHTASAEILAMLQLPSPGSTAG